MVAAQDPRHEWFEEWFDDTYLALYHHRDTEEASRFIGWLTQRFAMPPGSDVIDLACGAGRHSRAMAEMAGWKVVGLDLSRTLLRRAIAASRAGTNPPPRFIRGDLRALPLNSAHFSLAVNLFTSFGYFHDRAEHLQAVREMNRILQPDGILVLDLMNLDVALKTLVPRDSLSTGQLEITQERRWDKDSLRMEKTIRITHQNGSKRTIVESVRLFSEIEILELLGSRGFEIEEWIGSYDGDPFDRDRSQRMILLARKTV